MTRENTFSLILHSQSHTLSYSLRIIRWTKFLNIFYLYNCYLINLISQPLSLRTQYYSRLRSLIFYLAVIYQALFIALQRSYLVKHLAPSSASSQPALQQPPICLSEGHSFGVSSWNYKTGNCLRLEKARRNWKVVDHVCNTQGSLFLFYWRSAWAVRISGTSMCRQNTSCEQLRLDNCAHYSKQAYLSVS